MAVEDERRRHSERMSIIAGRIRASQRWKYHIDPLAVMCTLSRTGQWSIDDNGRMTYFAPVPSDDSICQPPLPVLVDYYEMGSFRRLPTMVSRSFQIDDTFACAESDLPDDILDRQVWLDPQPLTGHAGELLGLRVRELCEDSTRTDPEWRRKLTLYVDSDMSDQKWQRSLAWANVAMTFDADGTRGAAFNLVADIITHVYARGENG